MSGDTLSGYLMQLDTAGLRLFDPESAAVLQLEASQIRAFRFRRQGSFWSGWLKGFAAGESLLLMYVFGGIGSDDYFGPGFYIALGTVFIVTPFAIITGILEGSSGINLQHELQGQGDALGLVRERTQRYLLQDPDALIRTEQGRRRLERLRFDEGWKKRMHSIYYVPFISFQVLGVGFRRFDFDGQVKKKYDGWQTKLEDTYQQDNHFWRFGIGITLSPRLEIGVEKHTRQSGWVSLLYEANAEINATKEFTHYVTRVWALYRLKPYYGGTGSKWQHAVGLGWSGLQYDHFGYLSSETRYNDYQISGLANGATLLFRSSYFLTNRVSVEAQGELAGHEPIALPQIDIQQPEEYILPAEEINVFSSMLSLGIRLHL
ncbi:hypothetical protein [Marinoscillum furvescens]|nr:hypothetical protein [Marinoscillum furvescens]